MKDLHTAHRDYAVFLPAISGFMTELLGRIKSVEGYLPENRTPKGFEHGFAGLDFLNPDTGYYHYKNALYSAGHAYLNLEKSMVMEEIIHTRPKDTTIVGDSGGFQIGKGVIKFDWKNFFEKPGDMGYQGKADGVREQILIWLEATANWSMTLDVPSWAAKPGFKEKTGLRNFQECLDCTVHNNAWFADHRLGNTKFLNVLQGTYWDDAEQWYQAVKDFPFEGWGMGGNNIRDMHMALKRLIVLRDDGLLQDRNWMHFLGTSKLEWAVMLTSIQRVLRKKVNPNITISFDCASPYISSANGLVYTRNILSSNKSSYVMEKCFDNKAFSHFSPGNLSETPFPWDSEIGRRVTVGDVNWYAPGMLNKINKEGSTSWDSFTYGILMAHNVYMHIRAVQEANHLATLEFENYPLNWRLFDPQRKLRDNFQESNWTDSKLLMFNTFVEELFSSDNPMDLLDQAKPLLDALSNNKHKDPSSALMNSPGAHHFGGSNSIVDDNYQEEEEKAYAKLSKEL